VTYKKALKVVLYIHLFMFVVSFVAAVVAKSSAVLADSLDFIGDAASYFISFYVLGRGPIFQSIVAVCKALSMILFGIPVLAYSVIRFSDGQVPNYEVMTASGILGIIAHLICIKVLYGHRSGDSNKLSVWICTINDLLCNVLTVIASFCVLYYDSMIPDILAAITIVMIALFGAFVILRQAIGELKSYQKRISDGRTSKNGT
jgi:Co/Zn/Cd efflux system component